MAIKHRISIGGRSFIAHRGELLLDAALKNGIEIPHQCRAGHCGACCVRLVSGEVQGGTSSEAGVIHACQSRITGDAVMEQWRSTTLRTVAGVLRVLRPLSPEVVEIGIKTAGTMPHHPGQYALLRFSGYPARPYSITHPVDGKPSGDLLWFHMRRVADGQVTSALGKKIRPGHTVSLTGPYGDAYFRFNQTNRMVLVATNTGFAPIWSIAAAALRENPYRMMMVIAGGRSLESLYMGPALSRLARFPNVHVVPVCSRAQSLPSSVQQGRPTEFLPLLLPRDHLYACGAPAMVDTVKSIAARSGAHCYADPFLPAPVPPAEAGALARAIRWLTETPCGLDQMKRRHDPQVA